MKHQISSLANGIRIVTYKMKESQSVSASIFVRVGSRYEKFNVNSGVSHFLEHLLFKGTKKRPSAKIISEEIDAVGGYNNAYTTEDMTNFYIKVPKEYAGLALDILADMVRNPLLDPKEIDRERGVIIEEMNVYKDDPSRYVWSLIPPLIWPDDPLSRDTIGTKRVINSISTKTIVDYKNYYYSPANLVVSVAGNITHREVVKNIKKLMGDIPKSHSIDFEPVHKEDQAKITKAFKKDTNQAHFIIASEAYRYDHADAPATKVMTAILGAGMSSRLFINVRERLGLAYTVYSNYHQFVDTGLFSVYAGVNLDKIDQALVAVLKELKKIQNISVGETELQKGKRKLKGALQMALESNDYIADNIGTQLTLTNKIRGIREVLSKIDAVTANDVQRVAAKLLDSKSLRFAIIAPEPQKATKRFEGLISKREWQKI